MFQARLQGPQIARWQARLARVPRWGWIAFFAGAVVPVVALAVFVLFTALVTGAIIMGAVLMAGALMGLLQRLVHRRRLDDGRRNVQIVVHSARVIDP